jgi:hypothetical protein
MMMGYGSGGPWEEFLARFFGGEAARRPVQRVETGARSPS